LQIEISSFLNEPAEALKFIRLFPNDGVAFIEALELHKKLEDEAHARAEAERLQQEALAAAADGGASNISLNISGQNECCNCAAELRRLESRVSKQDVELERLKHYIEIEFSKLKPDEEKIRETRNSDEWIEGKWHLPTELLYKSAIDTDRSAALIYMDNIFGQQEFRRYRTFATMPEQLQKAANIALCKFSVIN
jgi:hypothetical protein